MFMFMFIALECLDDQRSTTALASGLDWTGLERLNWTGLEWTGATELDWTGLDWSD